MPALVCSPSTVAAAGACYCGPEDLQEAKISYLLAVLAGGSTSAKTLLASAKAWQGVDDHFLLADQVYLLASLAGGSTNAGTLAAAAACYCLPYDMARGAQIASLVTASGQTFTPNTLAAAAREFLIEPGAQHSLQAYLLAVAAGGSTDPATISKAACAFTCLPDDQLRQMWTYLACGWAQKKTSGGLDPAVTDWASRVVVNGGEAPLAATQSAMSTFVGALKACGIWTKMRALCCFVPDNLIAAITPLVKTFGFDPWTNGNFVAGDLSVTGLRGDGLAKYLDTGFNPTTAFPSNTNAGASISISVNDAGGAVLMEAYQGLTRCFALYESGGGIAGVIWNNSGATTGFASYLISGAQPPLFFSVNRNDAAGQFAQMSLGTTALGFNSVVSRASNSSALVPNGTCGLFARHNFSGAPIFDAFDNRTVSFCAFHDALTITEQECLYNAVQALRTSLGGGTV
jgi:hypothetical protein